MSLQATALVPAAEPLDARRPVPALIAGVGHGARGASSSS